MGTGLGLLRKQCVLGMSSDFCSVGYGAEGYLTFVVGARIPQSCRVKGTILIACTGHAFVIGPSTKHKDALRKRQQSPVVHISKIQKTKTS